MPRVIQPVLVLGCIFPDQMREAILHEEVRITTYTKEAAEMISNLSTELGKPAYIHVKLDTGMSRLGFQITEDSVDKIMAIAKMPGLVMEGLFTHFAKADETDKTFTGRQFENYLWMKEKLEEKKELYLLIIIAQTVRESLILKK